MADILVEAIQEALGTEPAAKSKKRSLGVAPGCCKPSKLPRLEAGFESEDNRQESQHECPSPAKEPAADSTYTSPAQEQLPNSPKVVLPPVEADGCSDTTSEPSAVQAAAPSTAIYATQSLTIAHGISGSQLLPVCGSPAGHKLGSCSPAAAPAAASQECAVEVLADTALDGSSSGTGNCSLSNEDDEYSKAAEHLVVLPHQESCIGGYQLLKEKSVGDGGLGYVLKAHHPGSGAVVALKLGSKEFERDQGSSDFTWWTFENEWGCYRALNLGHGLPWMPDAFQSGLYRTSNGVVPWISMELLGPSLHELMHHRKVLGPSNLAPYAHGMLTALENLHCAGFVHRDVKPANFVTQAGFDGHGSEAPRVVLIDFGFAQRWSPAQCAGTLDFCGTPDFASLASLRGHFPGPADDCEGLVYSLLQLYLRDMPWDITRPTEKHEAKLARENAALVLEGRTRHGGADPPPVKSTVPQNSSCGWTDSQLLAMAQRKEQLWNSMVLRGEVPQFLVQILNHCRSLPPGGFPDYAYLHQIIDRTYPPYIPKAAPSAAGPWALLAAAEE